MEIYDYYGPTDTKSDYLSNTDKIKLWAQRKTKGQMSIWPF
jgi:hypothetical protein